MVGVQVIFIRLGDGFKENLFVLPTFVVKIELAFLYDLKYTLCTIVTIILLWW